MVAKPHKVLGRPARNALAGALLVIGVIALYNWMVAPHVAYLHAVQQLAPAVERMAAENDRIRRTLGPDLRRLQSVRRERADVQKELFAGAEFTALVRSLPELVEQTGCTVIVADFTGSGDPGPGRGAEPNTAFTIRRAGVTVRGTLDQIAALLDRLQEHRPKVWVDAFRMERSATPPDPQRTGKAESAVGPDREPFSEPGADLFKCQLAMTMYTLAQVKSERSGNRGGPVP